MTGMKLTAQYKERFHKKVRVVPGRTVGFRIDQIKIPGGKLAQREYLAHPGAVGVLPVDAKGRILLVKQYRYPVAQFTYEIPAGKLAKGEDPRDCVERELEEEAGVRAKRIRHFVSYWPTAAFSNEVIHLYIATGLIETKAHPDDDEFLELVRLTPREIDRMIRTGRIGDSKTLIAFLGWKNLR